MYFTADMLPFGVAVSLFLRRRSALRSILLTASPHTDATVLQWEQQSEKDRDFGHTFRDIATATHV